MGNETYVTHPDEQFRSAGATYDIKSAMLYVSSLFPDAPIYGVGFSLGAVNLTKYLGTSS